MSLDFVLLNSLLSLGNTTCSFFHGLATAACVNTYVHEYTLDGDKIEKELTKKSYCELPSS